jgi:hypothetical protein
VTRSGGVNGRSRALLSEIVTSIQEPSGARTLAPPRGPAIAGAIFSILMIISLGLVRYAVPADLKMPDKWLTEPGRRSAMGFALDLVPFAGIAFLWFIGVLRNRLGELEDRFFATVFLGSGLLFVASLFHFRLQYLQFFQLDRSAGHRPTASSGRASSH